MDSTPFPLLNAQDIEILLHLEIHFGGLFPIMIDYYKKGGIGAQSEFSIKRLEKLQALQEKQEDSLAEVALPPDAKALIEDAKKTYILLREIYEQAAPSEEAIALSDLILTEEEDPKEEMQALINLGPRIVDHLIQLIKIDSFYSPLYPGFGRAPLFAAEVLGKIQDPKAIAPLFEMLGQENVFADEALLSALLSFGEQALPFLLKRVAHLPLSKENTHAAMALSAFEPREDIGKAALAVLQMPSIKEHLSLANYLLLCCAGLKDPEDRKLFLLLKDKIPGIMKHEADLIAKRWLSQK